MGKEYIAFKGSKDGVNIILSSDMPLKVLLPELRDKFQQAKDFFAKGTCHIHFSGRVLGTSDKLELEQTVMENLQGCDITVEYDGEEKTVPAVFNDIKEGYTKFHEGTLRSGQLLESEGNLVIIGDINPGAEVVAAGNIVVMGTARGIIHAGCTGNRDAFIVALNMSPTQIRIADIITRPPDNDVRQEIVPERAYIKDNTIYIDEYLTKM